MLSQGHSMYHSFEDFGIIRFEFSCGQTDSQTDADDRFTLVGVCAKLMALVNLVNILLFTILTY